jgi:hypothetical protein
MEKLYVVRGGGVDPRPNSGVLVDPLHGARSVVFIKT